MNKNNNSLENIQVCLLLSLLTLSANLFGSVSIIGDTKLMLGSSFVFLAIMLLPRSLSLFVAICALFSQVVVSQLWTVSLLFVLELIIILVLINRRIYLIIASLLYWTLLGVPILWLLNHLNSSELTDENLIITLQIAFNGLLNAAVAACIYIFIPDEWLHQRRIKQHTLSSNIFVLCSSTMVVPVLVTSFAFIAQQIHHKEKSLLSELETKALFIEEVTTTFLRQHQLVIEQLAMALNVTNAYSPSNAKMIEELMLQAQANHPSFFNITRTDKNGSLGFFAPRFYNEQIAKLPKNERTVKDRSYFIDARRELKTVTSEVILSKGVVEQPMISLAAPIFKQLENEQLFDGVMFGAIDLTTLNSYEDDIKAISPYNTVIVTDQKNRIVYSNKASAYKALSKFSYLPSKSQLFESIPLMVATHQSYLYKSKTTEFGWKVYVIQNSQSFTTLVREQFILVGFGLLLVLSAFLYIAYKLTNRITAPLKTLLDNEEAVSSDWLNSSDTSKEFSVMAKKLKRSSYLVKNYESRLKQQVEEKTERLEQRNQALALKARQDGLTKLLNRSGFNELTVTAIKNSFRHHQPFSIALLDLDNFKFINDTYGHPFGDKCLMAFAKHMQHFCKRDTDMIGRYGGEEFIIYLSGTNVESQHELINRIHQETQLIKIEEPKSGEKISFTVSAGVCSVKANKPYSLDELVLRADEALYKCKRNGRNQVSFITID